VLKAWSAKHVGSIRLQLAAARVVIQELDRSSAGLQVAITSRAWSAYGVEALHCKFGIPLEDHCQAEIKDALPDRR